MRPHRPVFRGTLLPAACLLLAALASAPSAAQGPTPKCTNTSIPAGGSCTVQGVTASFSTSATGSNDASADTVTLNAGWVYMNPPGSGSPFLVAEPFDTTRTPPPPSIVTVKTKYVTAGSSSPIGPSGRPGSRPARLTAVPTTHQLDLGSGAGRYLVGYANDTTVIVALLSGSLTGSSLVPGCQSTNGGAVMTSFSQQVLDVLQDSIPGARPHPGGKGTIPAVSNIPLNCFTNPCGPSITPGGSATLCTLAGYDAIFSAGTNATTSTAGTIALTSGSVFVSPDPSAATSFVVVTTPYVATDSTGTALDTTATYSVSSGPNGAFLVQSGGTQSMFVAVTAGTAVVAGSGTVTQRYQYSYTGAGYKRLSSVRRSVITATTTAQLCDWGAYLMQSAQCP